MSVDGPSIAEFRDRYMHIACSVLQFEKYYDPSTAASKPLKKYYIPNKPEARSEFVPGIIPGPCFVILYNIVAVGSITARWEVRVVAETEYLAQQKANAAIYYQSLIGRIMINGEIYDSGSPFIFVSIRREEGTGNVFRN